MFTNPDGPISIIYRFVQIKEIYRNDLNLICKNLYTMISDQMHLREDIVHTGEWYGTTYIMDICKNKKISKRIVSDIFANCDSNEIDHNGLKLLFMDKRIDPSRDCNYSIRWASNFGYTKLVKHLLKDSRVDPGFLSNEAIVAAADNGHLEVVKVLLKDSRVSPEDYRNQALVKSADNGHLEVVKVLLKDSRVDPNAQQHLAIKSALKNKHVEISKILINDLRLKHFTLEY